MSQPPVKMKCAPHGVWHCHRCGMATAAARFAAVQAAKSAEKLENPTWFARLVRAVFR